MVAEEGVVRTKYHLTVHALLVANPKKPKRKPKITGQ
jgi:hypothetical protein